jgi:hypothetical protein
VNKEPFKSKSGSMRRRDSGTHPVLARLPDVTAPTAEVAPPAPKTTNKPPRERESRSEAAGFVDYRFDMPAGTENDAGHGREPRPHVFLRRPSERQRSFGSSRVLPDSDPFSIPSATLADRLVPVARFVTVFLLATSIGTFVMSTRRNATPSKSPEAPPAAATTPAPQVIRRTLEPAPAIEHPTIASPTALGPLGAKSKPSPASSQTDDAWPEAPSVSPTNVDPFSLLDTPPSQPLSGTGGQPLPRVKTSELTASKPTTDGAANPLRSPEVTKPQDSGRPPAMARLPGVIFESPRNAYHDNHQPGLH